MTWQTERRANGVSTILITEQELQRRIYELGKALDARYAGKVPLMIGVLNGAVAFMTDLMRAMTIPVEIDFMAVSSYGTSTKSTGVVRILKDLNNEIEGRDVLVVEDIVDSGLMANLLGANEQRIRTDDQVTGKILENFVAMEIARLAEVSETQPRQYHYRQRNGRDEIDIVLEDDSGLITAAEVKAAATVDRGDYSALVKLRDARDGDFLCGVVFYTGPETLALTDRIWAVPISALWA